MSQGSSTVRLDVFGLIGSFWAGLLSYLKWHSLGWAVVHTLFSWVYVIYYFIRY